MLQQLSYIDLLKSIKTKVESNTKMQCYDVIPKDAPSPFYYVQLTGKRPNNTKTMYRNIYTVWIHVIAEPTNSSVPVMNYIQKLEESMSENIVLPDGFELLFQNDNGIQTIKTDETNEKHAVIEYAFDVCYGYKCK